MINNNVTNQLLLEVRVEKQLSPGGQGVVDHLLLVLEYMRIKHIHVLLPVVRCYLL